MTDFFFAAQNNAKVAVMGASGGIGQPPALPPEEAPPGAPAAPLRPWQGFSDVALTRVKSKFKDKIVKTQIYQKHIINERYSA